MSLAKTQRRAKTRMKESTARFSKEEISAARFFASYYTNFLIGMGVAVLGYKRGSEE
jgi:hypothetical protein